MPRVAFLEWMDQYTAYQADVHHMTETCEEKTPSPCLQGRGSREDGQVLVPVLLRGDAGSLPAACLLHSRERRGTGQLLPVVKTAAASLDAVEPTAKLLLQLLPFADTSA